MGHSNFKPMINSPLEAKQTLAQWRSEGISIGFVPTMGALHRGHLQLIEKAKAENNHVVVSIFVNPLQFNDEDDFINYPKNFDNDYQKLKEIGCELVINGEFSDFFPEAYHIDDVTTLSPGKIAEELEGAHRPGHFAGVKTIVNRLFDITGECRAYFGEKDYQQTKVISQLAKEKGFPTVVICDTIRNHEGLALSSRNTRLSDANKVVASVLYKAMNLAKKAYCNDKSIKPSISDLIAIATHEIGKTEMKIEYVAIKDDEDWFKQASEISKPRMLLAVHLAGVRLIDNMALYE